MNQTYNPKLAGNARNLRRNMTPQERHLWYDCLKQLPVTVHRQKVLGPYIVDFYIASVKIVVEVDGSQHYDAANQERDRKRDRDLENLGCLVLRYSNRDIQMHFQRVCDDIWNHMTSRQSDSPKCTVDG